MITKRWYLLLWMSIAGGVFIIVAGLALVFLDQAPELASTPTPASIEEVQGISVEEAKAAFDAGTAVFVDVRDSASYESSHIPGALSMPLSDLPNHLSELDPSGWIITYCG